MLKAGAQTAPLLAVVCAAHKARVLSWLHCFLMRPRDVTHTLRRHCSDSAWRRRQHTGSKIGCAPQSGKWVLRAAAKTLAAYMCTHRYAAQRGVSADGSAMDAFHLAVRRKVCAGHRSFRCGLPAFTTPATAHTNSGGMDKELAFPPQLPAWLE